MNVSELALACSNIHIILNPESDKCARLIFIIPVVWVCFKMLVDKAVRGNPRMVADLARTPSVLV